MSELPISPKRVGRPPSEQAKAHGEILQAVFELLQTTPVRDLTIEAVARRAGVGKPTIYRWWPTRAALLWAMFYERYGKDEELPDNDGAEAHMRARLRRLAIGLDGVFGKLVCDLIGEAQSDPELSNEVLAHKTSLRQATIAQIERGKHSGEFRPDTDTELVLDQLYAPLYYRLLMGMRPVTVEFVERLADSVFAAIRRYP